MSYFTPDQICSMFQIKKDKLYKMTSQKRIPFLKVGNELRFNPDVVTKAFEVKDTIKRVLV
jgi:excisionase family DNA binding protein